MVRMFCDICRYEFSDREVYGILQLQGKLYNAIIKGHTHVLEKENDDDEGNPFARMLDGSRDVINWFVCINCLRTIVALKEQVDLLHKQKHLGNI